MAVSTLDIDNPGLNTGPWILACEYCNWTSLDINIQFEKPNNIYGQLARLYQPQVFKTPSKVSNETEAAEDSDIELTHDAKFSRLKAFYQNQMSNSNSSNPLMTPSGELSYNSPSSVARIVSLYTSTGAHGKKPIGAPAIMRESIDPSEGLFAIDPAAEAESVRRQHEQGWDGTVSTAQQAEQLHPVRFIDDLKPTATLLRTKRSKRCRTCRHILVKPEAKVQSTRYKIKLVANNYVPAMTVKPLQTPSATSTLDLAALPPLKASQILLTLTNPMFDPIKVTLATPSQTPGRFSSRVTILCPQFSIGANTDVWDEALSGNDGKAKGSNNSKTGKPASESETRVAEAGKIWEKGRNWTTVVVEIVPAAIEVKVLLDEDLDEDEDVLEIPVFVRVEYEGDEIGRSAAENNRERREKRELAYWCVLGVGRIVRLGGRAS